jgi:hypothetical protein
VAAVLDGSLGRLAVLVAVAQTVRESRSDGLRPGGRSGFFPVRCSDAPCSGANSPRWHRQSSSPHRA